MRNDKYYQKPGYFRSFLSLPFVQYFITFLISLVAAIGIIVFLHSCATLKNLHQKMLESDTFTAPDSGVIYGPDGPHHYIIYPDGDVYIN